MKHFFHQLKFVKMKDILAIFVFLMALPVSWIYRHRRKCFWLVSERAAEARDNGYWFYKYMREQHPEQDCVYAIKRQSPDYDKVAAIGGEIIEFGSFKHWVYYLAAELNISSQKEGKPNAAVCYLLEVYGIRKNKRVYLKHGIVKDDLKWHYFDVTKIWMYVCSSERERIFCQEKFGYPGENIELTGLCRFDNLDNTMTDQKTVLIMPSHRAWLSRPIKEYRKYDNVDAFSKTQFFAAWKKVLTNEHFNDIIDQYNLNVVFFLHPNMQRYSHYFAELVTNVRVMTNLEMDLQEMLKKSALLISDYSSVFFDFAYMKKPLLYYQFDYEKFREGHYQEGYFSYEKDGFGQVCRNAGELISAFFGIVENEMRMPEEYAHRAECFFAFRDKDNCERTYHAIMRRLKGITRIEADHVGIR